MRTANIVRKTSETDVTVELNLDGNGDYNIETDFLFFKHMLEQLACHSGFDLKVSAKSLDGDEHHLVEDVAITLGKAISDALSNKTGIKRYGQQLLPMDEALILCAVDVSGRAYSNVDVNITEEKISDFSAIMLPHFFYSFVQNSGITVHIKQLYGKDSHHIAEAVFKSFARALSEAVMQNSCTKIPSTKGVL